MPIKTGSICFVLSLTALSVACGSADNGNPSNPANMAGTAGATATAGSNTGGGFSNAGTGTAGATANGGNSAGTAGTAAGGQNAAAGHGGSGGSATLGGQGGTAGSSQATAGSANGGGPASTAGLAFTGSCLYADHCTDEWDTSFGAAVVEQLCTAQQGTWSTGHCVTGAWQKKCTQAVFGGVYAQYLPADGICADGFEEQL